MKKSIAIMPTPKGCEETGYDGISATDIEDKMQEFLK